MHKLYVTFSLLDIVIITGNVLMLNTLGKNFIRQHFEILLLFFQKIGFDISCKCQSLFPGKSKKKKMFNLLAGEYAHSGIKVKTVFCFFLFFFVFFF